MDSGLLQGLALGSTETFRTIYCVRQFLCFIPAKRANEKAVPDDRITDLWRSDEAPVYQERHFFPNIVLGERLNTLRAVSRHLQIEHPLAFRQGHGRCCEIVIG